MLKSEEKFILKNEERLEKIVRLSKLKYESFLYKLNKLYSIDTLLKFSNNYNNKILFIAGRIFNIRIIGKIMFLVITDLESAIQLYVKKNVFDFKALNIGDIIYCSGYLFITKTNELTLNVLELLILKKSIMPFPKWYGLKDIEKCYKYRYLDLIINKDSKKRFILRHKIINIIRNFLLFRNYIEVETPILQNIMGGADAKTFETYHNSLYQKMYLRVSPELYLKRLIIGGFEKIFEIGKNFRNEGISKKHNPEFTMMEFYQIYYDYIDLMDITEELFKDIARKLFLDLTNVPFCDYKINFDEPFLRITMKDSIIKYNDNLDYNIFESKESLVNVFKKMFFAYDDLWDYGRLLVELFEYVVESKLINPTFITMYPKSISPLSQVNKNDENYVDRFEFFICGMELANGFSELTDSLEQDRRFLLQKNDSYDHDYVKALEYGLPPTAGEGIGIDRLVMLFTNSSSIRDVLFFPY